MTMHGLPAEVVYCKRCVVSNQRPNSCAEHEHRPGAKKATIAFDDDGVCDACRAQDAKDEVDWITRGVELEALLD